MTLVYGILHKTRRVLSCTPVNTHISVYSCLARSVSTKHLMQINRVYGSGQPELVLGHINQGNGLVGQIPPPVPYFMLTSGSGSPVRETAELPNQVCSVIQFLYVKCTI